MKSNKVLFSRNTKKQLIVWKISLSHEKSSSVITMANGLLFGKKRLTFENIKEGKNIGKSNETTIPEQAYSRYFSRIEDKKKKGYKEVPLFIEEDFIKSKSKSDFQYLRHLEEEIPQIKTDNEGFVKPMKASQYFKSKKNWKDENGKIWKDKKYYLLANPLKAKEDDIRIKFPCLIQPKINGVRALISYDENNKCIIRSKEGKIYKNLNHIEEFFNTNVKNLKILKDIIFDGELYIHNESLQTIASAVKKSNLDTNRVFFYCYDLAVSDLSNIARIKVYNNIKQYIPNFLENYNVFKIIKTFKIYNNEQVQKYTDDFIKENFEGSILRTMKDNYYFGSRKSNMVKLKRLISNEFIIKDIISQPKKPNLGMFVCQSNGKLFKVNPTFSEVFKEEILKNKNIFIGKKLQCSFYEYTDDNIPFHIVDTTIRDYE